MRRRKKKPTETTARSQRRRRRKWAATQRFTGSSERSPTLPESLATTNEYVPSLPAHAL
jgi:hypothetical protein